MNIKGSFWNGKEWVKVTILAVVPGNMVPNPSVIYTLTSEKEQNLYCSPMYVGGKPMFRGAVA